jgi:hypothetical protein
LDCHPIAGIAKIDCTREREREGEELTAQCVLCVVVVQVIQHRLLWQSMAMSCLAAAVHEHSTISLWHWKRWVHKSIASPVRYSDL